MSYLIDTNVISELRKQQRCHPSVRRWFNELKDNIDHKNQHWSRACAGNERIDNRWYSGDDHTEIRNDVGNADQYSEY